MDHRLEADATGLNFAPFPPAPFGSENRPAASVILPVRDAQRTLSAAIHSIRAQTFDDWELLIIDDGSSDKSPDIALEHARSDRRIRLLRVPANDRGIVAALNHGIAIARGGFIARMDADDVSLPARLEHQYELLRTRSDIGVVSCRVAFGGDSATHGGYAEHVRWTNTLTEPDAIALARFVESPVAHPSVMFRRELIERHGAYRSGDFPEDYELWLRWMDAGICFAKVPETLFVWNDPPQRLSRTDLRYSVSAFHRVKCRHLARWLECSVDARRPVWLWGAGRVTRKRFQPLETHGRRIAGFIDIDPRKTGTEITGRRVVSPEEIPEGAFVVTAVASRGARERITRLLEKHRRVHGIDFICAA